MMRFDMVAWSAPDFHFGSSRAVANLSPIDTDDASSPPLQIVVPLLYCPRCGVVWRVPDIGGLVTSIGFFITELIVCSLVYGVSRWVMVGQAGW